MRQKGILNIRQMRGQMTSTGRSLWKCRAKSLVSSAKIERSLEKINDGTYGVCDITGEEIPLARLEAIPYATMTVKAQEKFEKGLL